jgi:pyruvate kinase
MALVKNNAAFGNTKNMNLPGAYIDLPTLTEKDISGNHIITNICSQPYTHDHIITTI